MIACLILIGALIAVGAILRILHREEMPKYGDVTDYSSTNVNDSNVNEEICCGTHEICLKKNIATLAPVEYYDDEELDKYRGRESNSYAPDEIEEFREILLSLLPSDVAGWGISLEKRGVVLPSDLHDEFMLLMSEQ